MERHMVWLCRCSACLCLLLAQLHACPAAPLSHLHGAGVDGQLHRRCGRGVPACQRAVGITAAVHLALQQGRWRDMCQRW